MHDEQRIDWLHADPELPATLAEPDCDTAPQPGDWSPGGHDLVSSNGCWSLAVRVSTPQTQWQPPRADLIGSPPWASAPARDDIARAWPPGLATSKAASPPLFRLDKIAADRQALPALPAPCPAANEPGPQQPAADADPRMLPSSTQLQRLALALDNADNALLMTDRHGHIEHVNAGFSRMFGYSATDALLQHPYILLSGPHTSLEALQLLGHQHASGNAHQSDLLLYRKDGSPLWVSLVATPVLDTETEPGAFVNVFSDITAAKTNEILHNKVLGALLQERPLSESMTLVCQEIERVAPDLIVSVLSVDGDRKLRPLACPSLPTTFIELINALVTDNELGTCGPAVARGKPVLVQDMHDDPLFAAHREQLASSGLRACWSNPIKSSRGQILGVLAFYYRLPTTPSAWHRTLADLCLHLCSFAIEREQTKARVHQLAFYDALTALPNRMMFNTLAEQAMLAANSRAAPMALLFIDLDRFKRINETQGHAAGDGLLRDLAARMLGAAGKNAIAGRQAGDEFLLLLPDCNPDQATRLCERLLASIVTPLVVGHMTVQITASIGVAMFPEDGRDIDTLLQHADLAMYRAKDQGGGRFRFFSNDMNRLAKERLAMENALRDALRKNQLQLHYQPQILSTSHALYGVEALLRWSHPQMGNISPALFIPMAEECGLMEDISHWVLQQACQQQADWRRRGLDIPRISVNLSASNFESPLLLERLQQLLARHGLPAESLVLEITESVMLSAQTRVLENLDAIQSLGIQLSLDDFGTGYSSLSHLHRLPITELKLDKSFVRDIEHSETARTLITSVLRIGDNLRKRVVAEGVETVAQRTYLEQQGCEILQGYLCSPALPCEQLEQWLLSHEASLPR